MQFRVLGMRFVSEEDALYHADRFTRLSVGY